MEDAKVEGAPPPVNGGDSEVAELIPTLGSGLVKAIQYLEDYRKAIASQMEILRKLMISHNCAPKEIDIEKGLDLNFPSFEKGGRYSSGHARGRLADMADLLFSINIQGALSLAGYLALTSNGSSKGFFYLVVFLYGLGFLTALGGKLFCSTRMGLIGSMATILAFLINMNLLVIYKI